MFCFPSHYYAESFGIVLIEAMSFGLPIVTTRWRGIPDVVGESGGAFIVEPKRPDLVAAELEKLFGDSELRVVMGRKNREWFCDHYTIEIFRSGIERVLQEVGVTRSNPQLDDSAVKKSRVWAREQTLKPNLFSTFTARLNSLRKKCYLEWKTSLSG